MPTVFNGGKSVATQATSHVAVATSPDVCKTPGPPQPFPNYAKSSDLQGGTSTVTIAGAPVWTSAGSLTPSLPPHPQVGVVSGTTGKEARATSFSADLMLEGNPAVRHGDDTSQNHANTSGVVLLAAGDADLDALALGALVGDRGFVGHPVDVVTGRAFTDPIVDLQLPGPLPLTFARAYSSHLTLRDFGFGPGWCHTLICELEPKRDTLVIWDERGFPVVFDRVPAVGTSVIGPGGWCLAREAHHFILDTGDSLGRVLVPRTPGAARHRLASIRDRHGNHIDLQYDGDRLATIRDSVGRTVELGPTADGHIASLSVKDETSHAATPSITAVRYGYDDAGRLVTATDADGFSHHYAYDWRSLLVEDRDRTGLTFHFVYDAEQRCVESWGQYPGGRDPSLTAPLPSHLSDGATPARGIHPVRIRYQPQRRATVANSREQSDFRGNAGGSLDRSQMGSGEVSRRYREDGQLMARTLPDGGVTSWERDARGRVVMLRNALGQSTRITRDDDGFTRCIEHEGRTTTLTRNDAGQPLTVTAPDGAATSYQYQERGLVRSVTSPRGSTWQLEHDPQQNVAACVAPTGATWRWQHDVFGRAVAHTDASGATQRYGYSARGDLVSIEDAGGRITRMEYDGERRPVRHVDPSGGVTRAQWGGYGQLCSLTDPTGRRVELRYDLEGDLVEIVNAAGESHRYEFDDRGQCLRETTFDGSWKRYTHDAIGRVATVASATGQKTIVYDALGQIVERRYANGAVDHYGYDACGALISARNEVAEVLFSRDMLGRIVREELVVEGAVVHTVRVRYDADGLRKRVRTSAGMKEDIERDALGGRVVTKMRGATIKHHRDALGREIRRDLPAGGAIHSEFDALGRLVRRRADPAPASSPEGSQAARPVDARYAYDTLDRLVSASDGERARSYRYDAIGQLLEEVCPAGHTTYGYDRAGNPTFIGPDECDYGPGNRLLRRGHIRYRWDDDGRLIERTVGDERAWTYAWDARDLLQSITRPDGVTCSFEYDALLRRIRKTVTRPAEGEASSVTVTRFFWDLDVLVHELVSGDDGCEELVTFYHDANFEPVAQERRSDGARMFFLNDPAGAPERLLGPDGRALGEPSGGAWSRAADTATPIRLKGQYYDAETGLAYNRARYCDPDVGRFISPDPIGLWGGLHAYRYGPNPFSYVDPLGTETYVDRFGTYGGDVKISTAEMCDIPNVFTFGTHGTPESLQMNGSWQSDPVKIASTLKNLHQSAGKTFWRPGMPIRLSACNAGKGANPIAAKLAKEMGTEVTAPTGYLAPSTGKISENLDGTGRVGEWVTFRPDGTSYKPNTSTWGTNCDYSHR